MRLPPQGERTRDNLSSAARKTPQYDREKAARRFLEDARDTASPDAMVALLEKLVTGKALSKESTERQRPAASARTSEAFHRRAVFSSRRRDISDGGNVAAWRQCSNKYAGTSRPRAFHTEVVFLKERSLMDIQPKVSNLVLLGVLAAFGATAWGMSESMPYAPYTTEEYAAAKEPAAPPNDVVAPSESLSPNEAVVPTNDASDVMPAPIVGRSVAQPPITVETRRLTEDERIQAQVMDKLASTGNLSGKIGVESNDSVVRLSGWTSTSGQAWRAGNIAGSITGVKYVQNEIRPRVGGSI
jgi:hypothetical protein